MSTPAAPPVLESVDDLLVDVEERVPLTTPGVSGAALERVRIGAEWLVLKHLDHAGDWTLRALGAPVVPPVELWRRGVLAALPDCFDQPILAVAQDPDRPTTGALLMRDVGAALVPGGDDPVPAELHERFVDHMAALHAAFWDSDLDVDVVPPGTRYLFLSPGTAAAEAALGSGARVPQLIGEGWPLLERVAPRLAQVVLPLAHDPARLVAALAATPSTFVHGDLKLDNLGSDARGRTILLDWEVPGRGAPLSDLAWYLAINCRRIPTTKEQTIDSYRTALERRGVDTEPWWETQLGLCLVGAMVNFGWEKALGGYDDELAWWDRQVARAAYLLEPA
ncbi:phosphotransferase family protein [Nocardioides panacisoli]|uniref:Aminoglycoside phosphotransferase domain-containing protein n=1 Tax=Nocardioides panacisoli TaxID=627624 RepID=A0ABP7IFM2_9ACTN